MNSSKIVHFLLVGLILGNIIYVNPVVAQSTPDANATATPAPSPTPAFTPTPASQLPTRPGTGGPTAVPHEGMANCDACGYCNGMTLEEVPDRWNSCRRCIYKNFGDSDINPLENRTLKLLPTPDAYTIYTDLGCISSQPGEFAQQISSFFFSIVGGIAFMFFIYGSVVIATSRSDPGRLNKGRRIIYGAIVGLLFALFSVFILRFIANGIGIPNLGG